MEGKRGWGRQEKTRLQDLTVQQGTWHKGGEQRWNCQTLGESQRRTAWYI